ncbi:MAG: YecA family protein [Anaerolineae bacterium]
MSVGRNDPCPCGSGKKYKQCHLRQDQIASSREHALSRTEATAMNGLFGYAASRRFAQQLVEAFQRYWGGSYSPASASTMGVDPFRRMLEWFTLDYAIDEDGHRVIDLFLEEAQGAPQDVRQLLEAWGDSRASAFRLTSIGPDDQVSIFDLLRQTAIEVESRFCALNARASDLLLASVVRLDDRALLTPMTAIYPHALEEPLVAYVRRAYALFQDEHYRANWDAFLKANGHIFQAFLLSEKADPFRDQIGLGTPYIDPARIRESLHELTQEETRERRQRQRETEWRAPAAKRRPSGIIVPGAPTPPSPAPDKEGSEQADDTPRILIPGRDT